MSSPPPSPPTTQQSYPTWSESSCPTPAYGLLRGCERLELQQSQLTSERTPEQSSLAPAEIIKGKPIIVLLQLSTPSNHSQHDIKLLPTNFNRNYSNLFLSTKTPLIKCSIKAKERIAPSVPNNSLFVCLRMLPPNYYRKQNLEDLSSFQKLQRTREM